MEHIILDWKKIYISKGLIPIFEFLSNIEKEIDIILNYKTKLETLREVMADVLWYLGENLSLLSEIWIKKPLPENSKITDKYLNGETFNIQQVLTRSNMILVFSYIETLFCIITAYSLELDDQESIVYNSKNKLINNIEKYLIGKKNTYFINNKEKLWKLTAKSLKDLRNWLVHFYSISPQNIALSEGEFKKWEKITTLFHEENIVILSSIDLFELVKVGSKIFIQELAYDFKHNKNSFNRKIEIVKKVIAVNAANFVYFK